MELSIKMRVRVSAKANESVFKRERRPQTQKVAVKTSGGGMRPGVKECWGSPEAERQEGASLELPEAERQQGAFSGASGGSTALPTLDLGLLVSGSERINIWCFKTPICGHLLQPP